MKATQGKQPIFWLVRLLGAIGFVMAVVMIGQTGLAPIDTDRPTPAREAARTSEPSHA